MHMNSYLNHSSLISNGLYVSLKTNICFQTNLLPLVLAEVWLEASCLHTFPVHEFTYFFHAAEKQCQRLKRSQHRGFFSRFTASLSGSLSEAIKTASSFLDLKPSILATRYLASLARLVGYMWSQKLQTMTSALCFPLLFLAGLQQEEQ